MPLLRQDLIYLWMILMSGSLKPFFDFRNALVHRYRVLDDKILLDNCKAGYRNFFLFIETVEKYLKEIK